MRLIDAEALMQIVRAHDYPLQGVPGGIANGMFTDDFQQEVDAAPTVDAVPVRHGRWAMLSYDEAICTECGYDRNTPFYSTKEAKEHWDELPMYCEGCGAKMEEKKNK